MTAYRVASEPVPAGGRHCQKRDGVGDDLLLEILAVLPVTIHIHIRLDALGDVHGGAAADGDDRIATLPAEEFHSPQDALILRIRLKVLERDDFYH